MLLFITKTKTNKNSNKNNIKVHNVIIIIKLDICAVTRCSSGTAAVKLYKKFSF